MSIAYVCKYESKFWLKIEKERKEMKEKMIKEMQKRLVIRNYAVENGYHFRTALLEDGKFHIDCIDTWVYPYGQYMMDKKDILYTTLDEAVKSLGASRRLTVLPDGTEIIPEQVNYPSSSDVFIQWHPGIQELWPGEY